MKPAWRGAALMVVHCLLVLTVAGKYAWDRDRLPRAWANATPVDPELPVRGRYVALQLRVEPTGLPGTYTAARIAAENGRLMAHPVPSGGQAIWTRGSGVWVLAQTVACFLPEHAADPSRLGPGEELWVEVSVPADAAPRPLRLAIKKDGMLRPVSTR